VVQLSASPELVTVSFLLGAPTGDELAEYQKRQGLDEAVFAAQFNSNEDIEEADEDDIMKGRVKLLPVERRVSNAKQHAADRWLVMKKVKDWRGMELDNGEPFEFSKARLERFANEPEFAGPIVRKCLELRRLRTEAEEVAEGNSETSFDGTATPDSDLLGEST
jgi:hypothetical protein